MNISKGLIIVASGCALMAFGGCRRMTFDSQQWKEIVETTYTVDSVDKAHEWNLLQSKALSITANVADADLERVQVLSGNPYEQENVEILAERFVSQGQTVNPVFSVSSTDYEKNRFYAAAINSQGRYYVVPFNGAGKTGFYNNVVSDGVLNRPVYQTFTYVFEEDYPLPGDFDFNDVVLRISQQAVNDSTLKLRVTLAAVGGTRQIGGAIRLPDIPFSQVKRVGIEEGTRFDEGYSIERYFIDNDRVFVEGRDGSLVVNLFDDAHWSLNPKEEYGQVVRMFYNTRKYEVKDESTTVPEQTRTYVIHMREGMAASYMKLADIDPFIIVNSNGLSTEVHTYRYKYTEAIWHYTNGSGGNDDHVAWALLIPDGQFHYPVEGMFIGRYRDGEITGAYSRYRHSYGEWSRDRTDALDWWLYDNATKAQVY